MSEDLDLTAAESAEAAQSAVQDDAPSSPPPWGEDFDPSRAWKTITHLRDRERELEPAAKAFERLRSGSDPDALKEIAEAYGFELPEDEPDDIPDLDDPTAEISRQVRELAEWREQQEAQKTVDDFKSHVSKLSADANVALDDDEIQAVFQRSIAKGFSPESTEEAFKWLTGRYDAAAQRKLDAYLESLKSKSQGIPTPPQPGKAGEAQIDHLDRKARQARIAAIVAADDA